MPPDSTKTHSERLPILDGWRALSISFVLAGHLLPLGPAAWGLNGAVAACGMAIFFTLSGFLITSLLLANPDVRLFLSRRLFRILPLAWAAMIILIIFNGADATAAMANLLFYANLPPSHLLTGGEPLWSLCVEVQFYIGVALLVAVVGIRGLYVLPVVGLAITGLRASAGEYMSIVTWHRLDEILAGVSVALITHHRRTLKLPVITVFLLAPVALFCSHQEAGAFMLLRPYAVAAMVGATLYAAPAFLIRWSQARPVIWVAAISYGLYVIHGMLGATWLGTGGTLVKYAKRPLLIGATFLIAHLSLRYYELPMQGLGRRLSARRAATAASPAR